jgi:hypothetical protein
LVAVLLGRCFLHHRQVGTDAVEVGLICERAHNRSPCLLVGAVYQAGELLLTHRQIGRKRIKIGTPEYVVFARGDIEAAKLI